ncbi:MAG TPA: hypothetical protein PKZ17_07730 [Thermodesulfovibrio thiophilus]|nr:hypothetical protein [Thermodesulfovibrio thiophilus]
MFDSLRENKYFREIVSFLKQENLYDKSYLVGGSVRDLLLQKPLKDIDFAIKADTIKLAREFARQTNGSFVLLDEFFSIGRVVKDDITIDFAELRGGSIEADLRERDFTINSMAVPLSLEKIIDPFEGIKDLNNKLIKMVNEENLKADPLRVLRAYRFHATLDFIIENMTHEALKRNAYLMKLTARERLKDELWKILSVIDSLKTVRLMVEDEIFKAIFKPSEHLQIISDIKAFELMEMILKEPEKLFSVSLDKIIQKQYMYICLKFAAIFDFQVSEMIKQLKPSKKEQRFVESLIESHIRIRNIETLVDKVRFIRDFEKILYPALIYGISKDPLGYARSWFYRRIEDFYRKVYLKNKKKLPIIKGDEILKLGFEPSPIVGEILERIETLVLAGKIFNKEQAIQEIKKRYLLTRQE